MAAKRKRRSPLSKRQRRFKILGTVVIGSILAVIWAHVIAHISTGNWLGHENYYGNPVSTLFMLISAAVFTPIFLVSAWIDLKAAFTKPGSKSKRKSKA